MPMRRQKARRKLVMTSNRQSLPGPPVPEGSRSGAPADNGTWSPLLLLEAAQPPLTLYPPASFLAGLPGFEVVGVALAAPVHELAAALGVPAVVKTGDPGSAGPHLRGQEADLRVVSYGREGGPRVREREGDQPLAPGGEVSQGCRGASMERESAYSGVGERLGPGQSRGASRWGAPLPRQLGPEEARGMRGSCMGRRYLGDPEQLFPSGAGAGASARGYREGPWCPGSWSPRGRRDPPERPAAEGCAECVPLPPRPVCGRAVGVGFYVGVSVLPTPDGAGRACGEPGGEADSRPAGLGSWHWKVCACPERNSPPRRTCPHNFLLRAAGMTKWGRLCQ